MNIYWLDMKNKKICFVSFFAYSLFNSKYSSNHGGAEVQLYLLAKELAKKQQYDVRFVVGDFGQPKYEQYKQVHLIKAFPLIRNQFKYITGIYYQLTFFLTLIRTNCDVYLQRAAGFETGLVALYCKLFHKKFIYMVASSIDVDKGFQKINPLANIFYEFGLKNATSIIAQNKDQQELLEQNYHLKSTVIKNSFPIPLHSSNIKKTYVLWVGTSQALKQPQIFLNLAKSLPQYHFTIIIPKHDPDLWNNIFEQSKKIPNLHFIEKVPLSQINRYYAKAKLFINTSTFEGFPNTFVQATMNGTPIISLNVNPDNFLNKYKCGYCAIGDFTKLVNYTKVLLNNKTIYKKFSQNAYKYALNNHNIDRNIQKLIQLF